jgi:SAM-dependent methyltransferase
MTPAPVTCCRVLEIGCGDGSNLIPMAYALPRGRFKGVDLAAAPIAAGCQTASDLGLGNISLVAGDLREIGPESGQFDYILAHGVYSWVPPDVRDGLLRICAERLAPAGIAFISYNVLPGRHVRLALREMMLYHTRHIADQDERIQQARWFMQFLKDGCVGAGPWHAVMDREIERLMEHNDGSLRHDDLAEINDPVYFREFAAHSARHGLQYLGEADLFEMFDVSGSLGWLRKDVLEREQYRDFLRGRAFRQTLLCRSDVVLEREPGPESMDRFLFSAPARDTEDGQIEGLRRIRIRAVHDSVYRVAHALGDSYPLPLAFEELVPYAGDAAALREILFGLVMGGFADLHVYDFPCEESVTEHPTAGRLVRYQAARSAYVTNACHHTVKLDEAGRQLLCLMDGTRDCNDLAQATELTPEVLSASLKWMAGMALLET